MGIYIPGMKMPKDGCKSCAFAICGVCFIRANLDKPYEVTHSCPLIELPPHGRLIDADALMGGWMNLREATKYGNKTKEQISHSYSTMMMYEIADVIEDAPTIIPAEEGEI